MRMSPLSERKEDIIDPRYVNEELNIIRFPSEIMIGAVSSVELSVPLLGMRRTSVFEFLAVLVYNCSLSF